MKNFFQPTLFAILIPLLMPHYSWGQVGIATSGTRVVAVDNIIDTNGNMIIGAALGVPGTNPSTWTISNISATVSVTDNYNPRIFTNTNGDFIILWGYYNTITGTGEIAAAFLLNSSFTWSTSNISQNLTSCDYSDWRLVFDPSSDKAVAVWSGLNNTFNTIEMWASTIDLGVITPTWSVPFQLLI